MTVEEKLIDLGFTLPPEITAQEGIRISFHICVEIEAEVEVEP